MADQKQHDAELNDIEAALSALKPRASSIDRDRLMYLAGRASVGPTPLASDQRRWVWPGATVVSTSVALVLAVLLAQKPEFRIVHETVTQPETNQTDLAEIPTVVDEREIEVSDEDFFRAENFFANVPTPESLPANPNYIQLRRVVLAYGIDALPETKSASPPTREGESKRRSPRNHRELIRELLENNHPGGERNGSRS